MTHQIMSVEAIHSLATKTLASFGSDELNAGAVADIITTVSYTHLTLPTILRV